MNKIVEKIGKAAILGAALSATPGCQEEPEDETFYLNENGYSVNCSDVRYGNPPWLAADYCNTSMPDNSPVQVEPFAYQAAGRKKILNLLDCVFSPIFVLHFTDQQPGETHNTVFLGGRSAQCQSGNCQIGGETTLDYNNANQQDKIHLPDRYTDGTAKPLAMITNDTVHEIAHTLGVDHSDTPSFMSPKYEPGNDAQWNFTDAQAKQLLYNTLRRDDYSERVPDLTNIPIRCRPQIDALKTEPLPQ